MHNVVRFSKRTRGAIFAATLTATASLLAISAAAPAMAAPGVGTSLQVGQPSRKLVKLERQQVAGERFRTEETETLELVLSDGTSITLAPGSTLLVETYDFNRATGAGQLRVSLEQGSMRVMGGRLNAKTPIVISAGGATMELMDGGAFVSIGEGATRTALVIGASLKINAGGQTQSIQRAGYESIVRNGAVSEPMRQDERTAFADANLLNPGLGDGKAPTIVTGAAAEETVSDENAIALALTNRVGSGTFKIDPSNPYSITNLLGSFGNVGVNNNRTAAGLGTSNDVPDLFLTQGRTNPDPTGKQAENKDREIGAITSRIYDGKNFNAFTVGGFFGVPDEKPQFAFTAGRLGVSTSDGIIFGEDAKLVFAHPSGFLNSGDLSSAVGSISVDALVRDSNNTLFPWLMNRNTNGLLLSLGTQLVSGRAGVDIDGFNAVGAQVWALQAGYNAETVIPNRFYFDYGRADLPCELNCRFTYNSVTKMMEARDADDPDGLDGKVLGTRAVTPIGVGRDASNFVAIEALDKEGRRLFLATGDVEYVGSQTSASIDEYSLTRGLLAEDFDDVPGGADLNGAAAGGSIAARTARKPVDGAGKAFRSFLPKVDVALYGIEQSALYSTSLYVANQSGVEKDVGGQNALFQADLALANGGRSSTISATLGSVTYTAIPSLPGVPATGPLLAKVAVDAKTIGSSRSGNKAPPALLTSSQTASSAGGGNVWDTTTGVQSRKGYAGYLVLESVDGSGNPGRVTSLTGEQTGQVGQLRLATGYKSTADTNFAVKSVQGFIAGLVDVQQGATTTAHQWRGTIAVTTNAANNTAGATVSNGLFDPALVNGELTGVPGSSQTLGSSSTTKAANAYIKSGYYGAASADGNTAMIAGEAVKGGLGAQTAINTYTHTQWGFFWGAVNTPASLGTAGHAAFASWAANEALPAGYRLAGTAKYAGHMIGEVTVGNTDRYVATGSFKQEWNLDARTGKMEMTFDQFGNLDVPSLRFTNNNGAYAGSVQPQGGIEGIVQGQLGSATMVNGENKPGSTVGTFLLASPTATAVGTFGGDVVAAVGQ